MTVLHRTGILSALPIEARSLYQRRLKVGDSIALNPHVLLHVSGVGSESARIGAMHLLSQGVDRLMSWGTAASLDPVLQAGHVMMPEMVIDSSAATYAVDQHWHSDLQQSLKSALNIHTGHLFQSDTIIESRAEKKVLLARYQSVALDMESASIAAVARQAQKPFVVIRAIVDTVDQPLPHWLKHTFDQQGNVQVWPFISQLMRYPNTWLSCVRLARHFSAANKALHIAAQKIEWLQK